MLVLTQTTDTIKVVLGGAPATNQLRVTSTFRDITTTGYTPDRSGINTNGTTPVNGVAAPAASTQRVIDWLSIYNQDTAAADVTVSFDFNGTSYILSRVTLAPQERLEYVDGSGFRVLTAAGAVKNSLNQGSNPSVSGLSVAILASDVTNNNGTANTIADVTGLSFAVVNGGTYWFRFTIMYTAAATTTGSRWSINGPTASALRFKSEYSLTTTSNTVNEGLSAYDTPAASSASSAATGSNIARIEGFGTFTADGTVIARFASEISSSAIVAKAGSLVQSVKVL